MEDVYVMAYIVFYSNAPHHGEQAQRMLDELPYESYVLKKRYYQLINLNIQAFLVLILFC